MQWAFRGSDHTALISANIPHPFIYPRLICSSILNVPMPALPSMRPAAALFSMRERKCGRHQAIGKARCRPIIEFPEQWNSPWFGLAAISQSVIQTALSQPSSVSRNNEIHCRCPISGHFHKIRPAFAGFRLRGWMNDYLFHRTMKQFEPPMRCESCGLPVFS